MAATFDPYYTWLGIPPEDQPADHYRLLGVRQFESNPDVISNLTDQRMAHVKTYQNGPNGAHSQKLLNEIAAARVCLLNPEKRKTYDARLRDQIALKTAPEALPIVEAPKAVPPPPPAIPPELPVQSDSANDAFAFITATDRPATTRGDWAVNKAVQSQAKQRARARWLFIAAPILGIAAVVGAIMIRNAQEADDQPKPNGAATVLARADQMPGSAHLPASAGETSIAEPQKKAQGDKRSEEPNAPDGQHTITPEKLQELTAGVGNTESNSDAPQSPPADDAPEKPTPAAAPPASTPFDGQFPLGQWVDVLRLVDTNSKMVVAGDWSRKGQEISVEPGDRSRIAIPVLVKGSYDLEADFNRTSGTDTACAILPIGSHQSSLLISAWQGFASGFSNIEGRLANDPKNPTSLRPGNLENGHRYHLLVSARVDSDDHASIDVSLDGKPYLPHWAGDPATVSAAGGWQIQDSGGLGLGANSCAVTFHSARLKMLSGSASLDSTLISANRPPVAATDGETNPPAPHSEQPTSSESWAAQAKELIRSGKTAAASADRAGILRKALQLLNQAAGADRWSAEALRLVELAEFNARYTYGGPLIAGWLQTMATRIRREKAIADGVAAARETLATKPDDPGANTIVGEFLCFLMDDWAKGLPYLAKESDPQVKKIAETDLSAPSTPNDQFALGNSWWNAADKHSRLQSNPWLEPMQARAAFWYRKCEAGMTGSALDTARKRIAEQEAAANELAALADGKLPFPLGGWVDVLRFVDTGRANAGNWSRNGGEVTVRPGATFTTPVPITLSGSYDLEIGFTRTSGTDCLCTMLPVGPHQCRVILSGWFGRASGLDNINNFEAIDPNDPIAVRPGNLQNGHPYLLAVNVRVDSDEHASVDVSLDGRPYLPHWAGDPSALGPGRGPWNVPNQNGLGFGAANVTITLHSARLRMLSGTASLDSGLAGPNAP